MASAYSRSVRTRSSPLAAGSAKASRSSAKDCAPGDKAIAPDDSTQAEIRRAGVDKVVGAYKVCINTDGAIETVSQVKSTGFPSYDQKIQSTIRNKWRYKPFLVGGKASAACTAVRFVYSAG